MFDRIFAAAIVYLLRPLAILKFPLAKQRFFSCGLIALTAVFFTFLLDFHQGASAQSAVLTLPLDAARPQDLSGWAEAGIRSEINRQFQQNAALTEVEVVVIGDRHGEIVPISTTRVSRSQWQETPRVGAWTEYYSSAYALLQRHEGQSATVAAAPVPAPIASRGSAAEVDRAFDEGRLTGTAAQQYLSQLD